MNKLEQLKESAQKLVRLLEENETGCFTWWEAVNDRLKEIKDWNPNDEIK